MLKKKEEKKEALFKEPEFSIHDKFIDAAIHDPESFTAIHAVIDALIVDRDKFPNKFIGFTQIYASQLKMLYIYEAMLQKMLKLDDKKFGYLKRQVNRIICSIINNINFEEIGKRIAENKIKKANEEKVQSPEQFVQQLGDAMEKEKAKKNDYIQ